MASFSVGELDGRCSSGSPRRPKQPWNRSKQIEPSRNSSDHSSGYAVMAAQAAAEAGAQAAAQAVAHGSSSRGSSGHGKKHKKIPPQLDCSIGSERIPRPGTKNYSNDPIMSMSVDAEDGKILLNDEGWILSPRTPRPPWNSRHHVIDQSSHNGRPQDKCPPLSPKIIERRQRSWQAQAQVRLAKPVLPQCPQSSQDFRKFQGAVGPSATPPCSPKFPPPHQDWHSATYVSYAARTGILAHEEAQSRRQMLHEQPVHDGLPYGSSDAPREALNEEMLGHSAFEEVASPPPAAHESGTSDLSYESKTWSGVVAIPKKRNSEHSTPLSPLPPARPFSPTTTGPETPVFQQGIQPASNRNVKVLAPLRSTPTPPSMANVPEAPSKDIITEHNMISEDNRCTPMRPMSQPKESLTPAKSENPWPADSESSTKEDQCAPLCPVRTSTQEPPTPAKTENPDWESSSTKEGQCAPLCPEFTSVEQPTTPAKSENPWSADLESSSVEKSRGATRGPLRMTSFHVTSREEKERLQVPSEGRSRGFKRSMTEILQKPISSKIDEMISECDVSFTAQQTEMIQAFFEMHDDDSSHSLDLAELLKLAEEIGKAPPKGSEEFHDFCRLMQSSDLDNDGELNLEEFLAFLAEYYKVVYARLFLKCDKDKSGEIDRAELKALTVRLKEQGFNVRGEDMADMFYAIDNSETGTLDWHGFCEFMVEYRKREFELLNMSAGFNAVEVDFLTQVFQSADEDKSGQLEISEVLAILETKMLKTAVDSQEEIQKIATLFSRIDTDKSMSLDCLEFLKLLRVWITNSDHSRQSILKVFRGSNEHVENFKAATQGSKTLKIRSSTAHLGGELNDAKIDELRRHAVQYDMEACILAEQWNLSIQEVRCLRECFEFCDIDASGRISPDELKPVLKTLGFTPITTTQKKAFSKVSEDAEFGSDLDIQSLVKFLVMYHEACAEEVLVGMKREGNQDGVPVDKLVQALYQVGQYMNKDGALALLQGVGGDPESNVVDSSTFEKMLAADRCNRTFEWRKKCGFTEEQLSSIHQAFTSYCDQVDGTIMEHDGRLLDALQLLDLKPGAEQIQPLLYALLRLDRAKEGKITYQDFLMLVRHLDSQKNAQRSQEEKEKAEIAGLDSESVQQIRQIFMDYGPNVAGELPMNKVQGMLFDLGVIKNSNECHQWKEMMLQIVDGQSSVSFVNLLDVLHRLEVARKR